MTKDMMLAAIAALKNDASLWIEDDYCLHVTLEDFDGFDDNWSEIDRPFDDADAVEAFLEMLENKCISFEDDYYSVYHFNDFDVKVGYSSFDI